MRHSGSSGYVAKSTDGGGTAVAPPTPLSDLGFEIEKMFKRVWSPR